MRKTENGLRIGTVVGTGLGMVLLSGTSWAACTAAPDCASLGYTKTASSCPNGGIKCPFDTSKWFCQESCTYTATAAGCSSNCQNVGSSSCVRNGATYYAGCGSFKCGAGQTCSSGSCVCSSDYKYNCSGTGYAGGVGTPCIKNGYLDGAINYYTSCTCSSGYSWSGGGCVKNAAPSVSPKGYCCESRYCGDYDYCKSATTFPDCSTMQNACTAAGGKPFFQNCDYTGAYHNAALYDCTFP